MKTELEAVFAAGGPLAEQLSGYRPRAGQLRLAHAVAEALDSDQDLVAEAATGTGKTLAYLIPVLLSGKRVILSTGTLNLQDQLFRRDLPLALRALELEIDVALLKGRANYLCRHRLDRHLADKARFDEQVRVELEHVARWARHTEAGEISELGDIAARSAVWPLVTSTQDNCLGRECPLWEDCHVVSARRQAQDADLVVVNHHLLFADLALKQTGFGAVLPGAAAVIIDEAHQVPDTAARFFSQTVSAWQISELHRDTLANCATASGALALLRPPLQDLDGRLNQARTACASLPERGEFSMLSACVPELSRLGSSLAALAGKLEPLADHSRELAGCRDRAAGLATSLAKFLEGVEGHVRWFSSRRGRFNLNLTPLDIATPLKQMRCEAPAAWVMTSATLAVAGRFDHYTDRLGLVEPESVIVESPFDYRSQARLWIPDGLPEPGSPQHTPALLASILPVLVASRGRAFLLFTAHRALQRAAQWLRGQTDFNLLVQEEAPRQVLLDRFQNEPNSLLLGAASFWEGVDVPGPALSVVVVDKLPFAAPEDPVLEATLKAVRERGENPFARVQLPRAVLTLKQGAGRLIRQAEDCGILILGDPRLRSRGYGKVFLNSLPPMPPLANVEQAVDFAARMLP